MTEKGNAYFDRQSIFCKCLLGWPGVPFFFFLWLPRACKKNHLVAFMCTMLHIQKRRLHVFTLMLTLFVHISMWMCHLSFYVCLTVSKFLCIHLCLSIDVLLLPSCRAPEASARQFVGPLKSRLTGTDPERIKEMWKRFMRENKQRQPPRFLSSFPCQFQIDIGKWAFVLVGNEISTSPPPPSISLKQYLSISMIRLGWMCLTRANEQHPCFARPLKKTAKWFHP